MPARPALTTTPPPSLAAFGPDAPVSLTAFADGRIVARGCPHTVARQLAEAGADPGAPLIVVDDRSGRPVDTPDLRTVTAAAPVCAPAPASAPTAGRPRLGVVSREVTLLPRHWEWLAAQSGGASATLRRLIDAARSQPASPDTLRRQARDACYHAMSALAGDRRGFEAASRALFSQGAGARADFLATIAPWPEDLRGYLTALADAAFAPDDS